MTSCEFVASAFAPGDEPTAPGRDIWFVGRSNVGKSSLINAMIGKRGLARTSSTPGRTQSVNFYRVNDAVWFVDLPGYGYARVPEAIRRSWKSMIEGVFERRRDRVALALLIVDARREPTELDAQMHHWLEESHVAYLAVATKADKLSGNARFRLRRGLERAYGGTLQVGDPVIASSKTQLGLRDVWRHVDGALGE